MGKEGGAHAGLYYHVERSRDISYHHWQQKSRNTGLETCVAHRLSSLCSMPDFRHCRKGFSARTPHAPKAFGVYAWLPRLDSNQDNASKGALFSYVSRLRPTTIPTSSAASAVFASLPRANQAPPANRCCAITSMCPSILLTTASIEVDQQFKHCFHENGCRFREQCRI